MSPRRVRPSRLLVVPFLAAGAAGLAGCMSPVAPPERIEVRPLDVGAERDVVPGDSVAPHGYGDDGAAPAGEGEDGEEAEAAEVAPWEEAAGAAAGAAPPAPIDADRLAVVPDVEARLAQYAPTPIAADLSALSEEDRRVLDLVIEASRHLDPIFLSQVWQGNPALARAIDGWRGGERGAAREYFALNFGPWDRLAEMEPFLGSWEHPEGAGYYPEDLTREDFEAWLEAHPEDREAFTSPTTLIRRDGDGGLVAVPYSTAFREHLEPAAALLREAAETTSNASLARFLSLRADAFLSDDYYASDLAWMDLDAPVEVTIGPYETYEDGLFGYKAAFESFVTVALPAESAALARYEAELPWLERNLPIPDEHKNFDRGAESPIRVVDEVFTAGEARSGVATLAFNLPNDERVREAKGSKKVLLRNVMRAKYDRILEPIAREVLRAEELGRLDFQAYFDFVLHHELAHGLGPGRITVDGRETEVRLELRDLYATLEEAKADVLGVYDVLALVERGVMDERLSETLPATYLAGLFRSARFGLHEAHGRGVVAQLNYLLDRGAIAVGEDGRFRVVEERFPQAIRELAAEMLMLQARGDYDGTEAFLDRWGVASAELESAVERLEGIPVDVRAEFAVAGGE
ncbi:MAG TPA: peptidase [Thermoanaerobaculia bacterium]|nr:peptidase [Thermoanaerobaculia bacterium]